MEPLNFQFRVSEFDTELLPINAELLKANPGMLVKAIEQHFVAQFKQLPGRANIVVRDDLVSITWTPASINDRDKLSDYSIKLLSQGAYKEAEPILRAMLNQSPNDSKVALNLGMMLSDQKRFGEAVPLLIAATKGLPDSADAWNALGVAYQRQGNSSLAIETLERSHELEPENPYTLRNLGALISQSDPSKGLPYLKRAAEILPNDQQTQLGYGMALLKTGDPSQADRAFKAAIDIAPYSQIAELARNERTRLSHQGMRERGGGAVRMDVVMYITAALKTFKEIGREKTGSITFEVAMLGRSGLDINDPQQKYSLKSLPGSFSGLHLLAIMYTGLKQLAPEQDAGVDFSEEYKMATEFGNSL